MRVQAWVVRTTWEAAVGGAGAALLGAWADRDIIRHFALALVRQDVQAPHVLLQLSHPALHCPPYLQDVLNLGSKSSQLLLSS